MKDLPRITAKHSKRSAETESMRSKLRALSGSRSHHREDGEEPRTSLDAVAKSKLGRMRRNKGSTYERRIAALFAEWTGDVVKRTPLSGGWAKADFGVVGDLVFRTIEVLHVEIKKHEGWLLEDLLTGTRVKKGIAGWWEQTTKDCPRGRIPLLVFSRNLKPDYVLLRSLDLARLDDMSFSDYVPHFTYDFDGDRVVIMELRWLFARVRPPKGSPNRKTWTSSTVEGEAA